MTSTIGETTVLIVEETAATLLLLILTTSPFSKRGLYSLLEFFI